MTELINFPSQALPSSMKTKEWRKKCVLWAQNKTFFNFSLVRNSVIHKKINYDLIDGNLHMSDMAELLNPEKLQANFIPDKIQHYAIMNSKLNILRGEEYKRPFDYKVVVTNPNAVSDIEESKEKALQQDLQNLIKDEASDEEDFKQKLDKLNGYYLYDWQDEREIKANCFINHYSKECNFPLMFNQGFMDAMTVGEEIYQCDIVGGEPHVERLNPLKIRVFKSGYSNRIEDADIVILEDYWSPGKVIDNYYDVLSKKDIDYLEHLPDHIGQNSVDSMDNIDERYGFINSTQIGDEAVSQDGFFFDPSGAYSNGMNNSLLPYDVAGNVRVLRVYWKSKRRIKKVKSYDPETGAESFDFYPETYLVNSDMGEEEQMLYINEAWEGTMVGDSIFVNMRPRVVQYNRLSNPSRCHFGIIGSVYNFNDSRPFSLVDMMKPFAYMYDIIHDRLNKAIAANWGKIVKLDLAMMPRKWTVDKWLYYAKMNGLAVSDSFNEGNIGASTGKLAGALNNNSNGVIDAEQGNYIQQLINILEFLKSEMSDVAGISKQREGQISNRETVGGVERATLQSSHITEYLFAIHEDVKKRVVEAFIETGKEAMRGRSAKFQYIMPDRSMRTIDIDGDEFADADYGVVMDLSNNVQDLNQKLDTLAQAALQNQKLQFSTIMKLYSSCSLSEKQRLIETDEQNMMQQQEQMQQQQLQQQQQMAQMQQEQRMQELQQQDNQNIRDNETRVLIAQINASQKGEDDGIEESDLSKEELLEKVRQFDEKMRLERDKLALQKSKNDSDTILKKKALNAKPKGGNS